MHKREESGERQTDTHTHTQGRNSSFLSYLNCFAPYPQLTPINPLMNYPRDRSDWGQSLPEAGSDELYVGFTSHALSDNSRLKALLTQQSLGFPQSPNVTLPQTPLTTYLPPIPAIKSFNIDPCPLSLLFKELESSCVKTTYKCISLALTSLPCYKPIHSTVYLMIHFWEALRDPLMKDVQNQIHHLLPAT